MIVASGGESGKDVDSQEPFRAAGEHVLIPGDFSGVDDLVDICWDAVEDALINQGYGDKKAKIHIAMHEALVNAWKHGNRKRADLPITFRWRFAEDFTFEVLDAGQGFSFQSLADPCSPQGLIAESGRGLFIIRVCSASVRWEQDGRHIIVTFTHP